MDKKKKNKKFTELEITKNLQEFVNKHDLGKCIVISISRGSLWYSEDLDCEIVTNSLYSTIGEIYAEIIEKNGTNQEAKDWANQDIETAIRLMKKLYLGEE